MNRVEALAAARKHVDELANSKNDRGYNAVTMTADQRLAHELRIAQWLVEEDEN